MSWFRKSGISKWISSCKESSRLNYEERIDTAAILKMLDKILVQVNCIVDGNTKRNERLTKIEKQLKQIIVKHQLIPSRTAIHAGTAKYDHARNAFPVQQQPK